MTICRGKAEIRTQAVPHIVAVQDEGVPAVREQASIQRLREGRLACGRQASKPNDGAAMPVYLLPFGRRDADFVPVQIRIHTEL